MRKLTGRNQLRNWQSDFEKPDLGRNQRPASAVRWMYTWFRQLA